MPVTTPHRTGFGCYLARVARIPILSAEEERTLVRRIHDETLTDMDRLAARNYLIEANLRLVVMLARGFRCYGDHLEQLVSAGNQQLVRAAERYDPATGARFSTYATRCIRLKMCNYRMVNTQDGTVRVPGYLIGNKGVAPGKNYNPNRAKFVEQSAWTRQRVMGLDAEDIITNAVSNTAHKDLSEAEEVSERTARVREMLSRLDPTQRRVMELRFGLDGEVPASLEVIGRRIGLTKPMVYRLECLALRALREMVGADQPTLSGDPPRPQLGEHMKRIATLVGMQVRIREIYLAVQDDGYMGTYSAVQKAVRQLRAKAKKVTS